MIVYISHPLSGTSMADRISNVVAAQEVCIELIERGYTPICPHLMHYVDLQAQGLGVEIPYERWIEMCLDILPFTDVILYLGSSPGTDRELVFAAQLQIPIYYRIEDLPLPKNRNGKE